MMGLVLRKLKFVHVTQIVIKNNAAWQLAIMLNMFVNLSHFIV